jgi:hypothetical protein
MKDMMAVAYGGDEVKKGGRKSYNLLHAALNHVTPLWVAQNGGWERSEAEAFAGIRMCPQAPREGCCRCLSSQNTSCACLLHLDTTFSGTSHGSFPVVVVYYLASTTSALKSRNSAEEIQIHLVTSRNLASRYKSRTTPSTQVISHLDQNGLSPAPLMLAAAA